MAIVFPRNVIQDWLSDNKKFIQSPNKSINFTYSISHPESKSGYENLKGQLITTSKNKFKLTMGPRILYSNGVKWVSHDSRTNQAIIQNPDSLLYNSIRLSISGSAIPVIFVTSSASENLECI